VTADGPHVIHARLLGALRGLAVGDAFGAATDHYRPNEIDEVYGAPVTELVEPISLYPECGPKRGRGQIGTVASEALRVAEVLASGATVHGPFQQLGWAVVVGAVARSSAPDDVLALAASLGGGPSAATIAAMSATAVQGFLVRDVLMVGAETATRAGSAALGRRLINAAGAAQAAGGRNVGAAVAATAPPGPDDDAVVAFAGGVAFGAQSVRRAIVEATSQGGRASLSAALAGALCGALFPRSSVESWSNDVERASELNLATLTDRLIAASSHPAAGARTGSIESQT